MSKTTILAVSLAAWSSIGQATAQDRPSAGTSIASTLATAKLTEVRGDLALAQSQLEAAIHGASAEERAQLRAVLLQLRQRSGADTVESTSISAAAAQGQEPGKADPVMRLVRKLDEGTTANKDVEFAVTELRSLGRLIDTALIAELPKLGPFGLDNAMTLLNGSEHPTLLPTLESMLAKGDPAVAQALALRHVKMRSSIAIPLARRFAGQEYSAQTRFYALAVLLRHTDVDQGTLALLAELAEDKSVRKDLLDLAERDRGRDRVRAAARNALLEQLARTPDRAGFRARSLLLVAEQNLEEAQAVEQLMLLPDDLRGRIARQLAMKHTAWVEVAAMAIGVEDQSLDEWWVSKVEWSRQPDVAMRALLRRPDLAMANQLPISIASLVENGWTLSEELEAPFLRYIERSNGWWTLVGALPADAEHRALAIWQAAKPESRRQMFRCVVKAKPVWHELLLTHMEWQLPTEVMKDAAAVDWTGIEPAQVERFVRIIARCIEASGSAFGETTASHSAPPGAPATNAKSYTWASELMNAYGSNASLPHELLVPLVEAGDDNAWSRLARRAPLRALSIASTWAPARLAGVASAIAYVANLHGDARHVELVIAICRIPHSNNRPNTPFSSDVSAFLGAKAAGVPAVLALGVLPHPWPTDLNRTEVNAKQRLDWLVAAAAAAASQAAIEDLEQLLPMLPDLHESAADALLTALDPQWTPAHVEALERSLKAMLDRPLDADLAAATKYGVLTVGVAASRLLWKLSELDAERADDIAQAVLAAAEETGTLAPQAAMVRLAVAGDNESDVVVRLLDHPSVGVVGIALASPAIGASDALRAKVQAKVVAVSAELGDLERMFDNLSAEHAREMATSWIRHASFPKFSQRLADSIVSALGDAKDPELSVVLAKGLRHLSPSVRAKVAVQLGRTFSRAAAPFLIEMLRDDTKTVRDAASQALEQISNYLTEHDKWRTRIK